MGEGGALCMGEEGGEICGGSFVGKDVVFAVVDEEAAICRLGRASVVVLPGVNENDLVMMSKRRIDDRR
jgi:hypothetical protein